MADPLVEVRNLKKYFPIKGGFFKIEGYVHAVDGVSFNIYRGETLGLVGESGCGKSTLARTLLMLITPTEGEILFEGRNILNLKSKDLLKFRREAQIVYQDPYSSLNPRMTVKDLVTEPIQIHEKKSRSELRKIAKELLSSVGLREELIDRYPHELSGGQRQRVAIARAIALNPKFIILDEPTSSLDVSVQAQILNLLKDLQKRLKLTYLFISHNLSVVKFMSRRIMVMYLGKIIEMANADELFVNPMHPYTQALLSSIPIPDPNYKKRRFILRGEVPSPVNPPLGCRFHPRCPYTRDVCEREEPPLREVEKDHFVACHLFN